MSRGSMFVVLGCLALVAVSCQTAGPRGKPETTFALAVHVPRHPDQIVASPGDQVTWTIANGTGRPIVVTLTEFKRRPFLGAPELVSPFRQDPRDEIPAGTGSLQATVRDDAPLGRYTYAIRPEPGTRFNTPEIIIVPRQRLVD